ncbi:hypothetical protein NC651_018961 [Populus alba x Populus x berolinensis]|nr:hypothetical protein NC651_018961 [Populus alba x Populus x berolinensis]
MTFSFLRNKVYGPITKYFPSGTWIYYSRRGEYYMYVGTKTISSDFLSIIIVLLIALLIFTGKYFPMLLWIRCGT